VDSVWEQKKLEATQSEMLAVDAAREASQRPVHIILVIVQDALSGGVPDHD